NFGQCGATEAVFKRSQGVKTKKKQSKSVKRSPKLINHTTEPGDVEAAYREASLLYWFMGRLIVF
ncbi:MAG: hypothetical protein WCN89_04090, partial [bacterium]